MRWINKPVLCLAAALCPRTLLAVGTKLSERDVHALMSYAGRRLQNLHLGTSIIESIYCLRYTPRSCAHVNYTTPN